MSRFTVEFSDEVDRQIDEIQSSTGTTTKAEVVRKALNLLNYMVQEQKQGSKIVVENETQNVRKEIVTL